MNIHFHYLETFFIGIFVGFLGGLFGKGGSAIATPLLSLIGIPGFIAVAAPLPATVPGTFIASFKYWKSNFIDWQVIRWSVLVGFPATLIGSYLTQFTGAKPLLLLTGILVLSFGLSFMLYPGQAQEEQLLSGELPQERLNFWHLRLFAIALSVGLISGLLANSGGFLLAPAFTRILRLPIKKAFACSLAVSVFLALPGTVMHMRLGHIDWMVTLFLALGSVPFSYLGAEIAIRTNAERLERLYGIMLTVLGLFFLITLF